VYPVNLEETREINNQRVTIRPAKPVDERRIQEHFYNLDKDDVVSRFFHEKSSFFREEVEGIAQIDYVKNLTIVAVVGEFGFGKVVAIGEYLLDPDENMAEIAFSVSKDWQRKGLGRILINKLSVAAKENNIDGFYAYTTRQNQGMIHLVKRLPYRVETDVDNNVLKLTCKFD
jgi:RimJ/RimL family protein N-acetyltransferase